MLGLALRETKLSSDARDRSYDGILAPNTCVLQNNLLTHIETDDEKAAYFKEQFTTLRSCAYLEINELNGRPLVYPAQQTNCKITSEGSSRARAEGNGCFLNIMPYYALSVALSLRPECNTRAFLEANHIGPKDLDLGLDAYVAGDTSGISTDLDPIGSTRIRYSINPGADLLPVSGEADENLPQWPTTYSIEAHMGTLRLRPVGEQRTMTDLSLLVDNYSHPSCAHGLCSSPADFTQTFSGQVTMSEISNSGKIVDVDSWYYGNSVPARWQGILRGIQHLSENTDLNPQGHYQLSVLIQDPTTDYQLFWDQLPQMLIDIRQGQGTPGIDTLQQLEVLGNLVPLLQLSGLPTLAGGDVTQVINKSLLQLNSMQANSDWPPYYAMMCEESSHACRPTGKDKELLRLTTRFDIDGLDEAGFYKLKNFQVIRDSKFFRTYNKKVAALPEVYCPVPTAPRTP